MNEKEYRQNAAKRRYEIIMEWDRTDVFTDAKKLEYMMLDIMPYSRYWRMGMIAALKKAIKLLEKENKDE